MELRSRRRCLITLLAVAALLSGGVGSIGVNYGQVANNLPTPDKVVQLVRAIGATRVKLYDADPRVLRAFSNTGVEFIVGVRNEDLGRMKDPANARTWVRDNVQAYLPGTRVCTITVGNEILTFNNTAMSDDLLPAMQGVHEALVASGLDKQVSVTTAHSLATLQVSYPPSAGAFRKDLLPYITPILDFHSRTGSCFLINAYPYFAYKADPKHVPIDFVLFQPNRGITDPSTNLRYDNMLFAQIDAVYAALGSVGYRNLSVQISETGWPSKGDADEAGATTENARKYNGNLIKLMKQKKGTPMRPDWDLSIYVFALFNENMKLGPTSERNYGLFNPDGTPAYALGITNSTTTARGGGGSTPPAGPRIDGYMTISEAANKDATRIVAVTLLWIIIPLMIWMHV
uniref:glucan endo-1,3-beta-D-glucosidase n=1 Tax=Kalanchoe fedtschenkoi TaxID=63787 RepID=A0A7N1A2C1_KALFE